MENHNEMQQARPDHAAIARDHAAIRSLYGLDKPAETRGAYETARKPFGVKSFVVIVVSIAVVGGCVAMWFLFQHAVRAQEEARFIAEHQRKIDEELERRSRVEYADIAFLDSFPPAVAITMDGKPLYARSQDGSYSELRARESTWINNLPIREDTVVRFSFEAEGFKPLTRNVAYYDWYPTNKAGGNPLQKVYRKIVLEPDMSPRVPECAQLAKIGDAEPCEWSVMREIVFREKYAEAVQNLAVEDGQARQMLKHILAVNPELARAAQGFDAAAIDTAKELPDSALPEATRNLVHTLMTHPYGLYGTITVETDSPDTRVFFMSEPLMVVKSSGSMSQVRIQPGEPYTFAVYGQGRPIAINEKLSLRLETNDAPAYITEILPHQWHCDVPPIEQALAVPAPPIPQELMMPDYRHELCRYSIKISVKFADIRAVEAEAAKQRENSTKTENTKKDNTD